ncbi:hypothetical protein WG68_00355 [Arsukibacterium ikkense]|uniref:Uncharacterized protein n=1 Tax=Arsukibacterium ikkense TaxID=336831 RepID=A0A0M2V9P3_9GAMM|nr:hypothetical protein [Arsukibacterium ikkense]KKO47144.1 hypothetical protein WG68_00355 [Arsukibacterium ikkense]
MLIDLLISKHQLKLQQCTAQYQQQQQLRLTYLWLLGQRAKQFLGSTPGLTLSFMAGILMQRRHSQLVKTARRLGGLHWLRHIL